MLIQVAYAISRTKNSKLKRFFLRIQAKKGSKVAAVALARKVLCILHHLLMNQEMYQEDEDKKNTSRKAIVSPSSIEMPIQEMIDCIVRAGYVVTKSDGRRLNWISGVFMRNSAHVNAGLKLSNYGGIKLSTCR